MRTTRFFITGILCLAFSVQVALAQTLAKKISLKVENATLPQVLQQMQQKYSIRFSYLNNEMPAERVFSAEIKDKPLAEVLDVLLERTDFGYRENQGQVIIKRGFPKNKPKATTFRPLPAAVPAPAPQPSSSASTAQAPAKAAEAKGPRKDVKEQEKTRRAPVPAREPEANANPVASEPQTEPSSVQANPAETDKPRETPAGEIANPAPAEPSTADGRAEAAPKPSFLQKVKEWELVKRPDLDFLKRSGLPAAHPDSVAFRDFHLGLVYPISTNGRQAPQYVNRVSMHLLMGMAAGLDGAEFSGIGNFESSYVRGGQFAGVFNIVQNKERLSHLGLSRNGGYSMVGGQFAGFMNVVAGEVRGGQFAGFLNLSGNGKGAQAAGFLNIARDLEGAQVAGFMNGAREVDVQVAGFLNVARTMKGAQIGLINIADSAAGVPIGLISLVRKNGYRRVELYYSDDFDANFTFKMGVRKFYNLLAVGVELQDQKRYGFGYGFGSEWQLLNWFRINTDLLSYYVVERSYEDFPRGMSNNDQLNLLNKFRLLGTLQLGRSLALFGGPTYNVMVSQYQATGSDVIGSSLGRNPFYNHTSPGGTNVKMWIGFNAGLRF